MEVAIVKYNAGNIYSVVNALRRMGIEPTLTDDPEQLRKADRVLFPGQGEARGAMEYLKARRLDETIRDLKQPVFGICVGQQLLCRHSEEGDVDCIGIFDAEVKRFQPERHEDKVPCMGWNSLYDTYQLTPDGGDWRSAHTCISYIATMCPLCETPSPQPTTYCPTLPRCTRTISTPASSTPRRAERWANRSSWPISWT